MLKAKKKLIANVLIGLVFIFVILSFYNTFSMDTEYQFESMVYDIEDAYIKNVSVNTSVELYKKYFDIDNCVIKVVDKGNKEITDGFVVNGSKTVVYDVNNNVIASYTNIIKGDFNSDGIIDSNDFGDMGKCLVDECLISDELLLSIDINDDGEFLINDVTLLDKAVTLGCNGITVNQETIVLQSEEVARIVAEVEPNYGVNLNVKWTSLDEDIATVDEAGIVTGHIEGETYIVATTMDGSYEARTKITVDNTIQLESYEGIGYVGGNDVKVKIKAIDYEGLSCKLGNDAIASCTIEDKYLVLKALQAGDVTVTVSSTNYGEVSYKFSTYSVYLNVMPRYLCMSVGGSNAITVSAFNSGELSFESLDSEIVKDAYMVDYNGRKMLRIDAGSKEGRTTLKVMESNAFTTNNVTIDVYRLSIPEIGRLVGLGESVSTTIVGDNLGELECVLDDPSKGTCKIEGNQLIIEQSETSTVGSFQVTVYNKFEYNGEKYYCGEAIFLVVVRE